MIPHKPASARCRSEAQELLYPRPESARPGHLRCCQQLLRRSRRTPTIPNVYSFRGGSEDHREANLLFVRVGLTMTNGDTYAGRIAERLRFRQHPQQHSRPQCRDLRHAYVQPDAGERSEARIQPHIQREHDYNYGVDVHVAARDSGHRQSGQRSRHQQHAAVHFRRRRFRSRQARAATSRTRRRTHTRSSTTSPGSGAATRSSPASTSAGCRSTTRTIR